VVPIDLIKKKQMLFGNMDGELVVAILENGKLVEIHFEHMERLTGNIYLGRIENIVPNLEAVFVNIGKGKNGFLRSKDIVLPNKKSSKDLQVGQKVLVQVKKDPIGSKGAQLTMNIGIPGRYLVYMPFAHGTIGVSKKILDLDERKRLHNIVDPLISKNEGVIVRTVSQGIEVEILASELEDLKTLWKEIEKKYKRSRKPKELYKEPDVLEYVIRERYDEKVTEIITNDVEIKNRLEVILKKFEARKNIVKLIEEDPIKLFNINQKLERALRRVVDLDCGGSIVIDSTEALTIIDVNSGSNISGNGFREMSLKTNLEASKEISRQLRLRNISGIVLIDFIDMSKEQDKKLVLETFKEELRKDKGKTAVIGFTKLGLLEMTRKRTSPPLKNSLFSKCPICDGRGFVISPKRLINRMVNDLSNLYHTEKPKKVILNLHRSLSGYMNGERRKFIRNKFKGVEFDYKFDWYDPNSYNINIKKK